MVGCVACGRGFLDKNADNSYADSIEHSYGNKYRILYNFVDEKVQWNFLSLAKTKKVKSIANEFSYFIKI